MFLQRATWLHLQKRQGTLLLTQLAGAEAMLPLWLEQDDFCLWVLREDTAWLRLSPHMASLKQNELMAC